MLAPRTYRHGRIIWAYLRSNLTGKRQLHPAIILNRNEDLVQPEDFDPRSAGDNIIHVIGVSTKHKQYNFPYVTLPFRPDGRVLTKLKQDCGAIIGWYDRLVIPDDVVGAGGGFGGDVPSAVMSQVDEAVRQDLVKRIGSQFQTIQAMLQELLGETE
jgi:hypothetical protein